MGIETGVKIQWLGFRQLIELALQCAEGCLGTLRQLAGLLDLLACGLDMALENRLGLALGGGAPLVVLERGVLATGELPSEVLPAFAWGVFGAVLFVVRPVGDRHAALAGLLPLPCGVGCAGPVLEGKVVGGLIDLALGALLAPVLVDDDGLDHLRTGLKGWFVCVACTLRYEVCGVRFRLTNLCDYSPLVLAPTDLRL